MATIKLNSIGRINGANCDHFQISVTADGVTKTLQFSNQQLNRIGNEIKEMTDLNYKYLLAVLYARWLREHGATLGQLPNAVELTSI